VNHTNITYNPLQLETAKYVSDDCNLVVLAPTSSGKTIVAEQYIGPTLSKGEKAIYLSPLKALTNEKLLDWQHKVPSIVAITGDHMTKPRPITESLILMTTEALDSKSRGHQSWLKKAGVIVSDESHLLSSPGRGDAFEVGLTRFAKINPDARIIFLSATIPNTAVLAEWLTKLNGKPTKVVETEWRPVEQEYHLVKVPDYHWDFIAKVKEEIAKVKKAHRGKQFLIFVHTVNMGNILSKALKCPFHYSKIPMEERHRIEEGYRKKSIQTLVCTSTLAYGLNLPADVGIIVGAHRGPMMVDPADLKQEAGRVGRYGLSEKGYVYFLFPRRYADEVNFQCGGLTDRECSVVAKPD
jgi:replicative superfamily II helicase